MVAARRSLVPDIKDIDPSHYQFLDMLDKRRLTPIDQVATNDASVPAVSVSGAASTVDSTASTNTTPYGFATQAQADAIVAAVNAFVTLHTELKTAVNSLATAAPGSAQVGNDTKAQLNALINEMQLRGAMEKS